LPELAAWVARVPLPPPSELRAADARRELSVLASRVFTRAETRMQFALHLLAHWTDAPSSDLQVVLADLGYLSGSQSEMDHG
jgi:hypothetical protein